MDNTLSLRGNIQLAEETLNVLKAELDSETLGVEKPGEDLAIRRLRFEAALRESRHKGLCHIFHG